MGSFEPTSLCVLTTIAAAAKTKCAEYWINRFLTRHLAYAFHLNAVTVLISFVRINLAYSEFGRFAFSAPLNMRVNGGSVIAPLLLRAGAATKPGTASTKLVI